MMREIKFRFYDGTRGKECLCRMKDGIFYYPSSNFPLGLDQAMKEAATNDKQFLMQYTGLKDKNGVEIYEGDIVVLWEKGYHNKHWKKAQILGVQRAGMVEWKNSGWSVRFDYSYSPSLANYDHTILFQVIGNIYENPELLKEDTPNE